MSGIEIGDLRGDGADVAALTRRVWHESYAGTMWFPIWDERFCRWQLPAEDHWLHVGAYAGDSLVGCFCAVPSELRAAGQTWPIGIASWCTVAPEFRAHGLTLDLARELDERHAAAGLAMSLGIVSGDRESLAYRMWSRYAQAYPDKLRFLFRFGYWAKLLDPAAMSRAGLADFERLGARAFAPLLGASTSDADAWRLYTVDDLPECARLLDVTTASHDWTLVWPAGRFGRQLAGEGVQTFVRTGADGRVAGFATVARIDFMGRAPVRAGVLDLWCAPGLGARALGGLCRRLREQGLELFMTQRSAMFPARTFAAAGFVPLPATDHLVAIFPRDAPPLKHRPRRWSLLFR